VTCPHFMLGPGSAGARRLVNAKRGKISASKPGHRSALIDYLTIQVLTKLDLAPLGQIERMWVEPGCPR